MTYKDIQKERNNMFLTWTEHLLNLNCGIIDRRFNSLSLLISALICILKSSFLKNNKKKKQIHCLKANKFILSVKQEADNVIFKDFNMTRLEIEI